MDGSQDPALTPSPPPDQLRRDVDRIVRAALASADAGSLVERALAGSAAGAVGHAVVLVAAGKAAAPMAAALARTAGRRLRRGLVVGTHLDVVLPATLEWIRGGHPLPDEGSLRAGRLALGLAAGLAPEEQLVVLLSGGASALLAAPVAGLTLADKQAATSALLFGGASIASLNCVRRHLSGVKGGRLAAAAAGRVLTLAISDVVGPVADDPAVIGSGPTVPDATTFGQALDAVSALPDEMRRRFPASVTTLLKRGVRGEVGETPKPGDPRLAGARFLLIGSRLEAIEGARQEATRLGYAVAAADGPVTGEAREAAEGHARLVARLATGLPRPACILSAGETTVTVRGDGVGGRNQEFALAFAVASAGRFGRFVAASVGTDGIDGPTDAAGAIVDQGTLDRARHAGLPTPARVLGRNDTLRFFDALGDVLRTGPTATNVGDLQVVLLGSGDVLPAQ